MNTFFKFFITTSLVLVMAILFSAIIMPAAARALDCDGNSGPANQGTVVLAQDSTVTVTVGYICNDLRDQDYFGLSSPTKITFGEAHSSSNGSYSAGSFKAGTELIFFLYDASHGTTWYTGPASRNSDGQVHADFRNVGTNNWTIGFNDATYPGANNHFNDIVINVTATPSCTANDHKQCVGNAVYWFNSCNTQGTLFQQCTSNQICQNAQCIDQHITCSTNTDCGTNAYTGSPFCQGNNVYQNYITYTCNSAGTPSSYCSNSTNPQLKTTCTGNQICTNGSCTNQNITCTANTDCGTSGYTGSPFCQGNNVYQNYITYTCNNPGIGTSYCSNNTAAQLKTTCTSNQICTNGSCTNQNITCSTNAQCGTSGYIGSPFCQANNVYQNYITYTCNSPGGANSYCSNNTAAQLKTTCTSNQSCTNGSCGNQNITCSANADCGTNAYTGSPFCQGNNVYQNYLTWTCNSPGSANSYCSSSSASQLKTTCSGNQSCTNGSCSGQNCTSNSYQQCIGNYLYWYDSCGNQQSSQYCQNGCSGDSCMNSNCSYHSYQQCVGSTLYWYSSCGQQQDVSQYCPSGCSGNSCQGYTGNCTYHSYQRCVGSYLYWYDSCGNQQDSQYCTSGCNNNSCQNYNYNYNYYGACTYHAYKLCVGNNIYWYDSCGTQQDFYQSCTGGLTCQYGQCVTAPQVLGAYTTYVNHYKTACYKNDVYWYDSSGYRTGLYKSCADSNSCTQDTCAGSRCSDALKCDGTTCATGSADYNTYCASANNNTNNNANNNANNTVALSVSFFAKQDPNSIQWQKSAQVSPNGKVYFMIAVANNSVTQANSIMVSANLPPEITSIGNLQANGVPLSGDIVSGINIGSLAPSTAKSITFEGIAGQFSTQGTKQAIASVNGQSDYVSINFGAASQQAAASVSSSQAATGFWEFLKRWYLWILVALVLIFLFVVIFRRLSSNS